MRREHRFSTGNRWPLVFIIQSLVRYNPKNGISNKKLYLYQCFTIVVLTIAILIVLFGSALYFDRWHLDGRRFDCWHFDHRRFDSRYSAAEILTFGILTNGVQTGGVSPAAYHRPHFDHGQEQECCIQGEKRSRRR